MPRVKTRLMKSSATRILLFGTMITSESSIQISPVRAGLVAEQGAFEVDHRGQQPPIVAAAEDHDLPQVRPHAPTAGHADGLNGGGRAGQLEAAGVVHFAQHVDEPRRPLHQDRNHLDPLDHLPVALVQFGLQFGQRQPLGLDRADGRQGDRCPRA